MSYQNLAISAVEKSINVLARKLQEKGFETKVEAHAFGSYQGSYVEITIEKNVEGWQFNFYENYHFKANGYASEGGYIIGTDSGMNQAKNEFWENFNKEYNRHLEYEKEWAEGEEEEILN